MLSWRILSFQPTFTKQLLEFLHGFLWPRGERYRYLPKVPETGLALEEEAAEEDLMGLVSAFLETLEEEPPRPANQEPGEEGSSPPSLDSE